MNQFPHDCADDHFAVLRPFSETLAKTDNDGIILHGDQGRHVERFPHPGLACLAYPGLAPD